MPPIAARTAGTTGSAAPPESIPGPPAEQPGPSLGSCNSPGAPNVPAPSHGTHTATATALATPPAGPSKPAVKLPASADASHAGSGSPQTGATKPPVEDACLPWQASISRPLRINPPDTATRPTTAPRGSTEPLPTASDGNAAAVAPRSSRPHNHPSGATTADAASANTDTPRQHPHGSPSGCACPPPRPQQIRPR